MQLKIKCTCTLPRWSSMAANTGTGGGTAGCAGVVHMSGIVQGTGFARGPVNAFPKSSPTPSLFPYAPTRVTRDGGCHAVTSAKCSLTRDTVH